MGLDLGKHGGLVLLAENGALLGWARTPLAGKEYDGRRMAKVLSELLDQCPEGEPLRAFVEQPAPILRGGASSPLTGLAIGTGYGRWIQALDMLEIGYRVIGASTWTAMFLPTKRKGMTREDRKAHLVRMARQRHPKGIPWDSLNKDSRSGVADALLIAEWGRLKG